MQGKRLSILTAGLAIFAVVLFATSICAAQQETVLHSFGSGTDGQDPQAGLVMDSHGNLYGTTYFGGIHGACQGGPTCGTVFELSPKEGGDYAETILHSFGGDMDGQNPAAGLIFDGVGNLYGTTPVGGIHGYGTVFELSPNGSGGWTETVLHSFDYNGSDGALPYANLVFDRFGNLYGTTYAGGIHASCNYGANAGCGTVFELSPREGGGWTETVLHSFNNNGQDGWYPDAGLLFDGAGNLYGTTVAGGIHHTCSSGGCGTVFELSPLEGGGWTEAVLHSFGNGTDGIWPVAGLTFDGAGNLYGTTSGGGIHIACDGGGCGTVFELSPREGGGWTETVLHSFGNGTDGAAPGAGLVFDATGNLYGTTAVGGIHCGLPGCGTVFALSPNGSGGWTETVLHSFGNGTDGVVPAAGLIFDGTGNLYGTTIEGGIHNTCPDGYTCGTVFELANVVVDWAQFRFAPSHTGFNPYEFVLSPSRVGNLALDWKYTTGDVIEHSSPAVANGVVYVGSFDFNVYALNASSGVKLWSYTTGNKVESSPTVASGVVYVGSWDNNVYALNASTGAKLWSYATGGPVYSSPAVANGVVYVGSGDNNVYALNASTGAKLWSYTTGSTVYSSPAVADGVVYVGSFGGNVYALNASTGAELWSYTTGGSVYSSPAVANGMVYVGSFDNNVYALNAATGAKLWSYTTGFHVWSSPAVANGVVYVGSYDDNVYALNAATGAKLWSYSTGGIVNSSPAVANGVVYVGSIDYNVYALNASTGAELWGYTTSSYVDSSPAVANGVVYVGSYDHNLYAFHLPNQ